MIRVRDASEFKRLLTGLADDIVYSHIHFKMRADLMAAFEKYPLVLAQSRTFWNETVEAHALAAISRISRAFDQEQNSLHLYSWLLTIKENLEYFGDSSFRERMRVNPFVASLAARNRMPDIEGLNCDIESCSVSNPLVRALVAHRGSVFAHRSARNTARGRAIGASLPLTWTDIESLLDHALTILNRYSVLFEAASYSTNIIGRHDYEYIFKSVNDAVERSRHGSENA